MNSEVLAVSFSAEDTQESHSDQVSPTNRIGIKQPLQLLDSRGANLLVGFVMASLWGFFAYRHVLAFYNTGEWTYLLICASEMLTAGFFMFRSAATTVSRNPLDWLFAIAGTFIPLFLAPASWGLLPPAKAFITLGIVMQIFGVLSLNRSFALVAAKRKIKTKGMYRFVRHPLYASYVMIFTGYILSNTTWMNFALYLMTMGFLFVRLVREEKHLTVDPVYAEYAERVRYRVIPFVF